MSTFRISQLLINAVRECHKLLVGGLFLSLCLLLKKKNNNSLCWGQLHSSVSPFVFYSPCSETQGARQAQTKTQEVHGHVALPCSSKHHGPGKGEGTHFFFKDMPNLFYGAFHHTQVGFSKIRGHFIIKNASLKCSQFSTASPPINIEWWLCHTVSNWVCFLRH